MTAFEAAEELVGSGHDFFARALARLTLQVPPALTDPTQKQEWSRILARLDGLLNTRN